MRTGILMKVLAVAVPVVLVVGIVAMVAALAGVLLLRAWWARRRWAAAIPQAVDLWAAGAFGIWSGTEDSAHWDPERARRSLADWYGATDAAGLLGTLDSLARGTTGNAAWDQVRAVDLVRMGLAAGYLDLEGGRAQVRRFATSLRGTYRSWDELAAAFEQGMLAWQASRGIDAPAETGRVQRNLPVLRAQVWPLVPWDAAL